VADGAAAAFTDRCSGSSRQTQVGSRAKKAEAALRISLARRSPRFSRSSSGEPPPLVARQAGPGAAIDLSPPHPLAQSATADHSALRGDPARIAAHCDGYSPAPGAPPVPDSPLDIFSVVSLRHPLTAWSLHFPGAVHLGRAVKDASGWVPTQILITDRGSPQCEIAGSVGGVSGVVMLTRGPLVLASSPLGSEKLRHAGGHAPIHRRIRRPLSRKPS
jgi:hypothetical protein